jgi:hypothetical protein
MSRINALSVNPGRVPEAAELILGQLAVNAADGRIYIELVSGLIICVGADISGFATAEDLENIDLSGYALQATVTQALTGLSQQLATLSQALSGKAALTHGHSITDVAELGNTLSTMQGQINGKQPAGNYALFTGVSGTFTVNVLASNNHIIAGTEYRIGTDRIARIPNRNGWQNPTGPISTAAFNSQSVTLTELAKRVSAVIQELRYHGLLSTYGTTI